MKTFLITLLFITTSIVSFGQNNYEIITQGSTYTVESIEAAFDSANFCGAHFQTKRNRWKLDDGTEIEILSASELPGLESSCIISDDTEIAYCEYSISSGVILKKYAYEPSDQKKKESLNKSK